MNKIVDYFYKMVPDSSIDRNTTEKIAIRLLEQHSTGLLFFAIRWATKYYPYSFKSLSFLEDHIDLIKIRYETLETKKRWERRSAEYDPKNRPQTKNTPEWFRKGIDLDLFK